MRTNETMCCNTMEFEGLNDTEFRVKEAIKEILQVSNHNNFNPNRGTCIFSVAWDPDTRTLPEWRPRRLRNVFMRRYLAFTAFIVDNDLGDVYEIPAATNPNHDSKVKMGIWHFNKRNCQTYCDEQGWQGRDAGWLDRRF